MVNHNGEAGNTRKHGNNSGVAGNSPTKTVNTPKSEWNINMVQTRGRSETIRNPRTPTNGVTLNSFSGLQGPANNIAKARANAEAKAKAKANAEAKAKARVNARNATKKKELTETLEKNEKLLSEIMESISCHETSYFPQYRCSFPFAVKRTSILSDLIALETKLYTKITEIERNPKGRDKELSGLEKQIAEVRTSKECYDDKSRSPNSCSTPDFLVRTPVLHDLNRAKYTLQTANDDLKASISKLNISGGGKRTRRNRTKRARRTRRH